MTSGKNKKVKLEDQYDEEEDGTGSVEGDGDNGEATIGIEGEVDEERTLVEPGAKKGSSRVLRTAEGKAATIARSTAATEAVSWNS